MMTQIDWDYSAELKPPSSSIDASMQIQFHTDMQEKSQQIMTGNEA